MVPVVQTSLSLGLDDAMWNFHQYILMQKITIFYVDVLLTIPLDILKDNLNLGITVDWGWAFE